MKAASLREIRDKSAENFLQILQMLEAISDGDFNARIYPKKRTIAEITTHVIQVSGALHFLEYLFYKYVIRVALKPLNVEWYKWDLDKGKDKGSISRKDRLDTIEKLKKIIIEREKRLEKLKEKHKISYHRSVLHQSMHTHQLMKLFEKLTNNNV
ncbi:MAG: hypothetical protein ACW98K_03050 [Candidatus Kariarchaeaceae archaeon]|jgi:lysyl-tRNA synthetase class II